MEITTVGIDLAKNVFQVHAVSRSGEVIVRRALRRAQVIPFFAKLPSCLIGMEACGTSHHWARELVALGHEVRLMPPAYVKPYVKRGKTDAGDAEAICEAVTRPTMRFVPIKSVEQHRGERRDFKRSPLPSRSGMARAGCGAFTLKRYARQVRPPASCH
jgi:transposase